MIELPLGSVYTTHMLIRLTFLLLIFSLAGLSYVQTIRVNELVLSVGDLKNSLTAVVVQLASVASTTDASSAELQRRQAIVVKSQDQKLQEAVASVTPAVVSIVESRQIPQLQVTYENPFGNDPLFKGFGMQVPVYRNVGSTTQKISAGTGFLVRANGYIVTNKNVVPNANATYTVLLANGKESVGMVVWRSPSDDLAIIKIAGSGYPTVMLGDSTSLHLAESVFAVGNALGQYNNSVSVGVISGLNRTINAQGANGAVETLSGVIQTDAAINPGNSGGPLVNLGGDVVGVNVAVAKGSQSVGFALPITNVKKALTSMGI